MSIASLSVACAALAGCSANEPGLSLAAAPAAPGAPAVATVEGGTADAAATLLKIGKSGGGLASWYGDRFHGRPTANGERFDMGGFTAAHRSFPLPSYVRVTNVANGRSIVVRVNDRGPFHGARVIDVSRRTADVLGFRNNGVAAVKLDLLGPAPDGASDDRRLLASYQELGRAAVAPGTQVALAPVSDQELATEAMGYGGRAFAVASAAVSTSAAFVKSSASAVGSAATTAVDKALPAIAPAKPRVEQPATIAAAPPAPASSPAVAYAAEPQLASVPAAIAAPGLRVVAPSAPALASVTPAAKPAASNVAALGSAPAQPAEIRTASAVDVSSRLAAAFDSFGPQSGSSFR